MNIGVPKETKSMENRVAVPPGVAAELVAAGHQVHVEKAAGIGSGISDAAFRAAGACICSREEAWQADMVVKVKEPQPDEYRFLRHGLILFTYLHLANEPELTHALAESGCLAVAYETVQLANGRLPLLEPMSEIAGRLSIQVGARCLECHEGGRGVLLGGAPGVEPARVTVLGAGVVGAEAAGTAAALGADVTLLDINVDRLRRLSTLLPPNVKTRASDHLALQELLPNTDLLVGAVLSPGGRAPILAHRADVSSMPRGAVIVDVAIDQGGCVETSRATSHVQPTFVECGVVHYGVGNMPGAVARTSTFALANATRPYVQAFADWGVNGALRRFPELVLGVNVRDGQVVYPAVAEALGLAAAA